MIVYSWRISIVKLIAMRYRTPPAVNLERPQP
jgi:hypothetical protein